METKRCPYCRKLQRADALVCSRCGRTFLSKKSGTRSRDESRPSNPPASPHRAGHYAGLHPEDQPYQSSKIAVQRPSIMQDREWRRPLHEPEHIVLPPVDEEETLPVASRRVGGPTQPPVMSFPSQEKGFLASFVARPVSVILALACLFFLLASSIIAFALIGKSSSIANAMVSASPNVVRINDAFTLSGQGFTSHHWLTFAYDFRHPIFDGNQRPLQIQVGEDGRFSVDIRVPAAWGSGQHYIYVIDDVQKASISTSITVEQEAVSEPHLQLAMKEMSFGVAGTGVISNKMLTLLNTGGGQVQWRANSDQPWLTAAPGNGTFSGRANVQIEINRGTLAPGTYIGRMTFLTPLTSGKENGDRTTALTLEVTMAVDAAPTALTVSTTSLAYAASPPQSPAAQSIVLQNSGDQPIDWNGRITTNDGTPWLAIYPAGGQLKPGASASVIVSAQAQKLVVGSYQGMLIFSSKGQTKLVTVSLSVTNPPTPSASVEPVSSRL